MSKALKNKVKLNNVVDVVADYGADPTGVADSTAAIQNALNSGAGLVHAVGIFKVSGTLNIPDSVNLVGDGSKTVFNQTSTTLPTILLNGARSFVRDLRLQGPNTVSPYVGIGIQIADTTFSGIYQLSNVRVFNFNIAFRLCGALWTSFYDCWAENNTYGWAFDAPASINSTSCWMYSCTSRANDRNGIVGLSVPVRNIGLTLFNCNIENNGSENPATYAQISTGSLASFSIENCYIETPSAWVTKPDGINLNGCGDFTIKANYFNNANRHIFSTSAISYGVISANRFLGTVATNSVDLPTSTNLCIYAFANESDKPIVIACQSSTGINVGSGNIVGKLTDTQAEDVAFPVAPVLYGKSTAGSPTYSIQSGRYSRVGNQVHFRLRVSITAVGGIAGSVYIKNLPFTSANSALCYSLVQVSTNGVTLSLSNTYVYGTINPNSSEIELMQDGSVAGGSDIQGTALAAATTFIVSGTYTV